MFPRRFLTSLAVLAALTVSPSLAWAGPITWSYRTQITYAQDYGSNFRVMLHPDGAVTQLPGEYGFAPLLYSSGNPWPEPGSHVANYQFQATVTITDAASGHSIDQVWNGSYTSEWSYPPELANDPNRWRWDYESSHFGDYWDRRSFTLGNNRYTVWAYGGGQGQFPNGELTVIVDSIQSTPEPATLALAGVGLATLMLRRRGIRRKNGHS